jgi:hypothetical protein
MNTRSLGALIALNQALLATLVVVGLAPQPASAQPLAGRLYIMVAGDMTGRKDVAAIYIIEMNTARVAAINFNTNDYTLNVIGGRDMQVDSRSR